MNMKTGQIVYVTRIDNTMIHGGQLWQKAKIEDVVDKEFRVLLLNHQGFDCPRITSVTNNNILLAKKDNSGILLLTRSNYCISSPFKFGDIVRIIDWSYSLTVIGNEYKHSYRYGSSNRYKVLAVNQKLPTEPCSVLVNIGTNDLVLINIDKQTNINIDEQTNIVFTQSRFCQLLEYST